MIAIVAPYRHGERTFAALRLAEEAVVQGREVRLIAFDAAQGRIHPFWDHRVWSSSGVGVCRAAQKCRAVIHFEASRDVLARVTLVTAARTPQILVPRWHGTTAGGDQLRGYHRLVAPSSACYAATAARLLATPDRAALDWVIWDAGLDPVRRRGPLAADRISACIYADSATVARAAVPTLSLILGLLHAPAGPRLTLLTARAWPRPLRRRLARLAAAYPDRFRVVAVPGLGELTAQFRAHDWAVFPGPRCEFGIVPLRAQACGCGVIAWDVPPLNQFLCHGVDALLIPCGTRASGPRAVAAAVDAAALLATCTAALGSSQALVRLQRAGRTAAVTEAFRTRFRAFWGEIFLNL